MSNLNGGIVPQSLDANMRVENEAGGGGLRWLSAMDAPIAIAGFPWLERERIYRRLPAAPAYPLRTEVDRLANCTAGGQLRFLTDSSSVVIKAELAGPASMDHMPATGQCGFDCYIGGFGAQSYIGTTRMTLGESNLQHALFDQLEREMREVTIHFPLYQGVRDVWIGIDGDAAIEAPIPYRDERKIICYGTSITQGGCAARPGMAYPNILSRRFPYEFVNLGFSGNGKGEPELARIIASIGNPGLLVLDYTANVSAELYRETLPAFIGIYREAHPKVPILVVSKIRYPREDHKEEPRRFRLESRAFAIETVERLKREGDAFIFFQDGDVLLGDDYAECTVDGTHPTDLGFMRMADGLTPALASALGTPIL